jgi:hypothetical protein
MAAAVAPHASSAYISITFPVIVDAWLRLKGQAEHREDLLMVEMD